MHADEEQAEIPVSLSPLPDFQAFKRARRGGRVLRLAPPSGRFDSEVFANFSDQQVVHLLMPGHCGPLVGGPVSPPGVIPPPRAPIHNPGPPSDAGMRGASYGKQFFGEVATCSFPRFFAVELEGFLENLPQRDEQGFLGPFLGVDPGTSSTQPIHQPLSCLVMVGLNSFPNRRCRNIARSTSTNKF